MLEFSINKVLDFGNFKLESHDCNGEVTMSSLSTQHAEQPAKYNEWASFIYGMRHTCSKNSGCMELVAIANIGVIVLREAINGRWRERGEAKNLASQ